MNLSAMKSALVFSSSRGLLIVQKNLPAILIIGGTVGVAVSAVMGYKATTKAEKAISEAKSKLNLIKDYKEKTSETRYSKQDYRNDLTIVYSQTGFELVKAYAPAVLLGVVSVSAIWGSHHILVQRNTAVMAAYAALDKGFKDYRSRVVAELGAEKDSQFRYNTKKEVIEEKVTDPETGKTKKVKETVTTVGSDGRSIYAKFFDETCQPYWTPNAEYNMWHLTATQQYFNDKLIADGHVFLNDVYKALGIETTQMGQQVGWWYNKGGDNFIDFGFLNEDRPTVREFTNGKNPNILLDFNVDGLIYQFLEK
jgi:hypothetical protein